MSKKGLIDVLTTEKVNKYFDITGRAIAKVKIVSRPEVKDLKASADDFFDMAKRYYSDAKFFYDKGDLINAFACLNYAHGWLDAGARLGLFDVGKDNVLFTVDD